MVATVTNTAKATAEIIFTSVCKTGDTFAPARNTTNMKPVMIKAIHFFLAIFLSIESLYTAQVIPSKTQKMLSYQVEDNPIKQQTMQ